MEDLSKNPITALVNFKAELSNGVSINIIHDLPENFVVKEFNKWLRKAKRHNEMNLVYHLKKKRPYSICVTKAQFDSHTKGEFLPATKEEYLKQESKKKNEAPNHPLI